MSKKAVTRTAILIASCAGVLLICLLFFASRASTAPSYQEYQRATPTPGSTLSEQPTAPSSSTTASKPEETPTGANQPERVKEEIQSYPYTLILRDGTLTVLAPDDPEQNGRIIDFDTSFLTQDEKQNLKNGIRVQSKEELLVLLEGFAS